VEIDKTFLFVYRLPTSEEVVSYTSELIRKIGKKKVSDAHEKILAAQRAIGIAYGLKILYGLTTDEGDQVRWGEIKFATGKSEDDGDPGWKEKLPGHPIMGKALSAFALTVFDTVRTSDVTDYDDGGEESPPFQTT
jgi:hypothetical protein